MENASKALIIAGAILLAILLISLGIMVYMQSKDTISDSSISSEEAFAFNSKFDAYLGDIDGLKANVLVGLANTNGLILNVDDATYTGNIEYPKFDNKSNFNATPIVDKKNGKITGIKISDKI